MKNAIIYLLMLFPVIEKAQFVTISGNTNPCPDTHSENYTANYSAGGSGVCATSSNKTYSFTVTNGSIVGQNPSTIPIVAVVWNTQPCPTSGSIKVEVLDNSTSCCSYNLPVSIKGYWNATISGPTDIYNAAVYNYAVNPPACGSYPYTWSFPSGWQCANGNCNTSNVQFETFVNPIPQSGQATVTSSNPNLCNSTQYLNVNVSSCYNKGILGEYDPQKINNRFVSGDFDNDGKEDDIAALYDYGNTTMRAHVWLSNNTNFIYQGDNGWATFPFNSNSVLTVHSGDFDHDGFKDDIACTYDYLGSWQIRVLIGNGTSFSNPTVWHSGFFPPNVENRSVCGDFDHDGYQDDIVAFYKVNATTCNMDLFTTSGAAFNNYSIAYSNFNFDASSINGRIIAGDFDRDGWYDDIAAFYDNGNFSTSLRVWMCNGGTFNNYQSWWSSPSYDCNKVTGNIVSGDFNRDGKIDDIAAFYYYGNWETRTHIFLGQGTSFQYQGDNGWWSSQQYDDQNNNRIKYRVVSGSFSNGVVDNLACRSCKKYDIAALYDYPCYSANIHVWKSTGTSLNYQGDLGWWGVCDDCSQHRFAQTSNENTNKTSFYDINMRKYGAAIKIIPNPNNGIFSVEPPSSMDNITIEVFNTLGNSVYKKQFSKLEKEDINISEFNSGIYYVHIYDFKGLYETQKIIKR